LLFYFRYHYPRVPKIFYVSLKVGQREFIGEGHNRQAARHCAAEKALKVLGNLPLPNQDTVKPIEGKVKQKTSVLKGLRANIDT
jgi:double-stranded RNA-binding protein Staufen